MTCARVLCHKFCWCYAANPVLLFHCASLFDQSPYVVSMRSSTSNELSSTAPIGVSSRTGPRVSPGCPSQFHTIHDLKFLTAVLHDWKLLGTNAELQKWEIHGNSKKFPSPEDTVCSKMFQNFDLSRSFFRLSLTFLPVPGSRFPSSPSSCRRGSGTCPRRKWTASPSWMLELQSTACGLYPATRLHQVTNHNSSLHLPSSSLCPNMSCGCSKSSINFKHLQTGVMGSCFSQTHIRWAGTIRMPNGGLLMRKTLLPAETALLQVKCELGETWSQIRIHKLTSLQKAVRCL